LLARTERLDVARLDAGGEATATTSPAGAILASTDAARALLERDGAKLIGDAIVAVRGARERLAAVDGLAVLDGPHVDPLKLVLILAGTGADGNAVEADLLAAGLPVEAAERDLVVAVASLADTATTLGALIDTLVLSIDRRRGEPRPASASPVYAVEPVTRMSPRAAYFAPWETRRAADAVGRVSVELVAPYPPGIPVLAPGEEVTPAVLAALGQARSAGVRVAYAAGPTLATLRVAR
jgi:lysine decarboxylase